MAQEYELVKGFETENGTGLYDYEALANKPGVVSTGAPGFAPQLDGKTSSFLRGDGTWATPPNTTYNEATQSAAGLMSAADKKKVDGMGTTISNAIDAIDFPVDSVNGKTGDVVLDHDDVGAVSWDEYAQAIVQKANVVKEAKGEVITVSDSAEAPLQGLKVFGKTTQNGTPTPDAPVALESVGDSGSVTTTVCGKNLMSGFTGTKENPYSITAVRDDNAVVLKETSAYMESGKPYTFSIYTDGILGNENGSDTVEWLLMKDGAYEYAYNAIGSVQNGKRISKTIIPQATGLYSLRLDVNKNGATHSFWDAQVEEGTQATEYEPYNGGSVTVSTPNGLPGIPVASGGNYKDANEQEWICDEVDFEKGVYVQRVYRQTYIGSSNESWEKTKTTAKDRFYTRYMVSNTFKPCLCNMAVFIPSPAYQNGKCFVTYDSSNGNYYFQIIAGDYGTFPDPPAWRRYLGEHPLEVLYVMAEEKEIPLSEIDPDALAQYAILHTNHPNTTVFNDGNAGMEVKYATPTTALPLTGGRYKVATPYAPTDAVPKSYADRIDKKVDTLREVVSSFHSNIVQEASGEVIQVYGSAEAPLVGLKVFGKTEQVTTTGKNLLDQHSSNWQTDDDNVGVKYSFVRDSNGNLLYINANGTADPGTISSHCKKSFTLLPAGTYIISGTVKQSNNSTGLRIGKGPNADYVGIETGDGYKITLTEETYIAINPTVGPGRTVSNLKFYPMIRLASETDATYEPYTGGIPSPNPEYPQALESVGDSGSVTTTVCGKNLLNYDAWKTVQINKGTAVFENNGVTLTASGDDCYTHYQPDMSYPESAKIPVQEGDTITVSWEATSNVSGLVGVFMDGGATKFKTADNANIRQLSYTVPAGYTFATIRFGVAKAGTTISYKNIQVEKGSVATVFEPSKFQTLPVTTPGGLPGIHVTSGGNYIDPVTGKRWICDEVDFEKGVYIQRVRMVSVSQTTSTSDNLMILPDTAGAKRPLSIISNYTDGAKFGLPDSGENIFIRGSANASVNKVNLTHAELNALLTETPMVLIYALAEENHIPLSEIDPDVLAQYATLHTNYPNTAIFNDAGAHMDLKYVADTKMYVDKKFEELAEILINKL